MHREPVALWPPIFFELQVLTILVDEMIDLRRIDIKCYFFVPCYNFIRPRKKRGLIGNWVTYIQDICLEQAYFIQNVSRIMRLRKILLDVKFLKIKTFFNYFPF